MTPSPNTQSKYKSVLHKNCGGEIVLVSNGNDGGLACKTCRMFWEFNIPMLPFNSKLDLSDEMEVMK